MFSTPVVKGNVARNCHPWGCRAQLQQQADYILAQAGFRGPKRVLVIGASSGFGLASRLALLLGAEADSIGIAYEKGPSEKGSGTAGWYNSVFFRQLAESRGRLASNIIADAFQTETREKAIAAIKRDLAGQVDLVVYSLASGRRHNAQGSWQSVLKTTGKPLTGLSINMETEQLLPETVPVATEQELQDTVKVMGGEDWAQWIHTLNDAGVLATGCQTLAFSYMGPPLTAPIYQHGSIGAAKAHLHHTAQQLNQILSAQLNGGAYACVAKALVTKASVYIPLMSPYIAKLYQVMKSLGNHEECIQQAYRLFSQHMYGRQGVKTDSNGLIRIDDYELSEAVQQQIRAQLPLVSAENFKQTTDYAGYREAFLRLNGFAVPGVDYSKAVDLEQLQKLCP